MYPGVIKKEKSFPSPFRESIPQQESCKESDIPYSFVTTGLVDFQETWCEHHATQK
jgi:hypothetical protein